MAKRLTDSRKWQDPFYRKLPPHLKLFWLYLLDACDHAGFWKKDLDMAGFCIGIQIHEEEVLGQFEERIRVVDAETWFVTKFISFQYGVLREDSKVHKSVIEALKREGLYELYGKGLITPKVKDKVNAKVKVNASSVRPIIQRIINTLIDVKGFDRTPDLINHYYKRYGNTAKELAQVSKNNGADVVEAIPCIGNEMTQKGLTWELETVLKWFPAYLTKGKDFMGNKKGQSDAGLRSIR